jgi:ribonucleoside-diphosphate reductase subunit M2
MSDSPAKKLEFTTMNKENSNIAKPIVGIPDLEIPAGAKGVPSVAATIKDDEKHEILLQENPQRFVLFPIQHHEVSRDSPRLNASRTRPSVMIKLTRGITDLAHVQEGQGLILDCRGD